MPNVDGSSGSSSSSATLGDGRAADRAASERRAARRAAYAQRMAAVARPRPGAMSEVCEGLHVRQLRVAAADVVFVKGIVEASEGLGVVFAESGGDLTIAVPLGREHDLARLLDDLASEVGAPAEASTDA